MKPARALLPAALLVLAGAQPLWGQAAPVAEHDIARFLLILAIMLVTGKFAAEAFERAGQPGVIGELVAGVVLGGSVLGIIPVDPDDSLSEIIRLFAEIGVLVLLFEIGLETDLKAMFRVGRGATSVACVGVTVPFVLGALFWVSPVVPRDLNVASLWTTAIYVGATLTATSVGITARVLTDMRIMSSIEAKLIIGAAVIDDIIGLVLLGIVATLVTGAAVSVLDVGLAFVVAIGFLVLAVAGGFLIAPRLFGWIDRMRVRGVLLVAAFSFVLVIAALADRIGSAMIIGAFASGVILSRTNQFDTIESQIKPVSDLFTPIFFLSIGAQFNVRLLNVLDPANLPVLAVGGALLVIAIAGKLVAGWAVPWRTYNRPLVGFGMVPRGEVGLIFAEIGRTNGVLNDQLFGAIILMVIGSTFAAPPLVKWSFNRWKTFETPAK